MLIVGVDPGANGGLAAYYNGISQMPDHVLRVFGVPKTGAETDRVKWAKLWRAIMIEADHIFIEQVGAMPGQGVTSMFNFGLVTGFVQALAFSAGVPVSFVRPQEWKKGVGIPSGAEKGASRIRASQLFPNDADKWSRVKDDGLAEAALIAYYGSLKLRGEK